MTIYYLKFNEVTISELLNQKKITIRGNAAEELRRHLENASWEKAKKIAVYNDEECFRSVLNGKFGPLWSNEGYGVCPYGGTRCDDGGPVVRKQGKQTAFAPVPGGKHNCLRCRHFISGTPFLIQMWMMTSKLLADSRKQSVEYDRFVTELKSLEDQKYLMVKEGRKSEVPGKMIARIKELEGICDMRSNSVNEMLLNLHVAWRFTESIKTLLSCNENTENNLPALLCSNSADFEFSHREGTRFEAISHILRASRVYPFLEDENMELEQERFVDVILLRENLMALCLQPLTRDQKRRALDDAASFLLTTVGAEETQQVYEGKVTLTELGLAKGLIMAIQEAIHLPLGTETSYPIGEVAHG